MQDKQGKQADCEAAPPLVTLREAGVILGVTYERVRQLVRAGVIGVRGGKVAESVVLEYAWTRAVKAQKAAQEAHAEALDALYQANREVARVRGLVR